MKKFKITKMVNGQYVAQRRNFFFKYYVFKCEFYSTVDEAITDIHKIYYPDECDIEIVDYSTVNIKNPKC
jgi:hypothetical protein